MQAEDAPLKGSAGYCACSFSESLFLHAMLRKRVPVSHHDSSIPASRTCEMCMTMKACTHAEAIAIRLEAIAIRLEAIAIRLEAIAIRVEAIAIRVEAIAIRVEAIAIRVEAIAIRVEAIGIGVASVSTHGGLSMETANFHSHEQRKAPFVPFEAGACAMDLCRYPASSFSTQVYPMYVI